jgi:hypothetical protein
VAINLPLTGGCHCGTLRYEISEAPLLAYTCHCTDCQRITGTAFSLAIIVPESSFRLTSGEPRSGERIASSGRVNIRLLCPDCGCWISGVGRPNEAGVPVRRVRAGTLDDRSWVRPTAHFFTRSKQPWVTLPDGDDIYQAQQPA